MVMTSSKYKNQEILSPPRWGRIEVGVRGIYFLTDLCIKIKEHDSLNRGA
jgi:hypothetical protein